MCVCVCVLPLFMYEPTPFLCIKPETGTLCHSDSLHTAKTVDSLFVSFSNVYAAWMRGYKRILSEQSTGRKFSNGGNVMRYNNSTAIFTTKNEFTWSTLRRALHTLHTDFLQPFHTNPIATRVTRWIRTILNGYFRKCSAV